MKTAYPLRHWLATLILGLVIFLAENMTEIPSFYDLIGMLTVVVALGIASFVFSFPVFILYVIAFNFLLWRIRKMMVLKFVLNVIAIVGMVTTVLLMSDARTNLSRYIEAYIWAITIASMLFRIRRKDRSIPPKAKISETILKRTTS